MRPSRTRTRSLIGCGPSPGSPFSSTCRDPRCAWVISSARVWRWPPVPGYGCSPPTAPRATWIGCQWPTRRSPPTSLRATASSSPTERSSCASPAPPATRSSPRSCAVARSGHTPVSASPPSGSRCRALTDADRVAVARLAALDPAFVAQSFLRRAADVEELRALLGPRRPADHRQDRDARGRRGLRLHLRGRRRGHGGAR